MKGKFGPYPQFPGPGEAAWRPPGVWVAGTNSAVRGAAPGAPGPLRLAQPLVEQPHDRVEDVGDHRPGADLHLGGGGHARNEAEIRRHVAQLRLVEGDA